MKFIGADVDENTYQELKDKLHSDGIPIAAALRVLLGLYMDGVITITQDDVKLYSQETSRRGGKKR